MKKLSIIIAFLFIGLVAQATHINGHIYAPTKKVVIKKAPTRYWVNGHYVWNAKRRTYVWVGGHYVKVNNRRAYIPAHYKRVRGRYVFVDARWVRV